MSGMTAFAPPSRPQNADQRFSLVPSQVSRINIPKGAQPSSAAQSNILPVNVSPRVAPQLMVATTSTATAIANGELPGSNNGILKRSRRRTRTKKKQAAATKAATKKAATIDRPSRSSTNTDAMSTSVKTNNTHFTVSGNLPDIYWRAISMEHLRQHPNFIPLPEPHTIRELHELEHVRNFQQQSWQWDTLHHGRCTTSQAVAALGFLEPLAGEFLNVPLSWRRGAMGAFVRLREKPMRTLDDMKRILIVSDPLLSTTSPASSSERSSDNPVWAKVPSENGSLFAASYQYIINNEQMQERKKYARKLSQNENLSKTIRMMWGNTQEATALLTAINFFTKDDPNCYLEEVGMCGAGLELNTTSQCSSLLIGATPDGVLRYSDGRIEALEVKNHCPFFGNSHFGKGKNKGGKRKRFTIGCMPLEDGSGHGIFAHYVPQLQLEMLCLGPECRSAIMVRQTATAGALVLRMHRDDEWIDEMLYWLHRFQIDFVEQNTAPPKNFFWNSPSKDDRARYRRFANKTKEIRTSRVEVVRRIHNNDIQRMGEDAALFLD